MRRFLSLTFIVFSALFAKADKVAWYLMTDEGYYVPMSRISMLVAVDENDAFSVLDHEGRVLVSGVRNATFEQVDEATVIKSPLAPTDNSIGVADNEILLMGASAPIVIYNTAGIQQMEVQPSGSEMRINIAGLPKGVYIAKCGKQSFKFSKNR